MVVKFINQKTKDIYYDTTLSLTNLFWKNSHILFYCYGINITLNSLFREPPVNVWDDDNMPFPSCELIFYVIVSVQLFTDPQN